ncbi:MAG: AAA family ATPase [Patescibacteria group bacterium]|nr:AAA family ATPase [Patescibacteria group bacterium]
MKMLDPKIFGPEASNFKAFLEKRMMKQKMAIDRVVKAYNLSLSPIRNIHPQPIFAGFFTGPSGTGKTFLAELISEYFYGRRDAFIKIDCSNYSQEHELAQLIGSPPGYVGYYDKNDPEKRGTPPMLSQENLDKYFIEEKVVKTKRYKELLSRQNEINADIEKAKEWGKAYYQDHVKEREDKLQSDLIKFWTEIFYDKNGLRTKPISIILLDEIDKAHQTLHNFLLPVLDSGTTTLKNNDPVSFLASFIIMTSNAGSRELAKKNHIGFISQPADRSQNERFLIAQKELEKMFRPEFRGRIKENIVYFEDLDAKDLMAILEGQISDLMSQLAKNFPVIIAVPLIVKKYILEAATDHPEYGARMIKQKVDKFLRQPLANLIASGQISVGDKIVVALRKDRDERQKIAFFKV